LNWLNGTTRLKNVWNFWNPSGGRMDLFVLSAVLSKSIESKNADFMNAQTADTNFLLRLEL
jgi:hypothetical protein